MSIESPTIIEGGIPILGGLRATALGYGVILFLPRSQSARPTANKAPFDAVTSRIKPRRGNVC